MFSMFWRWCLKYMITGADNSVTQKPVTHVTSNNNMMLIPGADIDSTFDRLPVVVVGTIFGKLPIGDRARMRLVSKAWRDVLVRSDFPVKPEPPWLIQPVDFYVQPGNYIGNQISFESMSEERTYRFDLRYKTFCGTSCCSGHTDQYSWFCCGSSSDGGSWLLMAGRRAGYDVSSTAMILWDPISGTTKTLPALSTLPFFGELVDTCVRNGQLGVDIFSIPAVITQAQVFSVGSVECVVAVAFSGTLNRNLSRLALCSPHEQSWIVVPYGPGEYYMSNLFHNGHLYTICKVSLTETRSASTSGPGVRSQNLTARLSCCDVEVTKLEIVCEEKHQYYFVGDDNGIPPPIGSRKLERWNVVEHLVGSEGGLLVVTAVIDKYSYNGGGQGPPIPTHTYSLTRGFEVYGLDVENANNNGICCLERLRHVGKQCLFVGGTGSTSLVGVDCGNVIHFATNDANGVNWNNEQYSGSYVVHERGAFDVPRDKIETTSCRHLPYGTRSCAGWFTPKLC